MKKILITSLTTLLVFTATLYNACKVDKCKQVSCAYGGVCKDGNCLCQTGYEGDHCETVTRDKFIGIWNVNEDGTLDGAAQYAVSIEAGPQINQVLIKNFRNDLNQTVTAIVYKDTLTIPVQTFPNGTTVSGWSSIVDTNPLNQHYYQHAIMNLYYTTTDVLGNVNEFGTNGSGPSIYSK